MNAEIVKELDKILPVVERVHGDSHPELHQVAALYAELKEACTPQTLEQLRKVTDNYTVPADACPTFAKTYQDLAALDAEHG